MCLVHQDPLLVLNGSLHSGGQRSAESKLAPNSAGFTYHQHPPVPCRRLVFRFGTARRLLDSATAFSIYRRDVPDDRWLADNEDAGWLAVVHSHDTLSLCRLCLVRRRNNRPTLGRWPYEPVHRPAKRGVPDGSSSGLHARRMVPVALRTKDPDVFDAERPQTERDTPVSVTGLSDSTRKGQHPGATALLETVERTIGTGSPSLSQRPGNITFRIQ